jgi:hypothetical protein
MRKILVMAAVMVMFTAFTAFSAQKTVGLVISTLNNPLVYVSLFLTLRTTLQKKLQTLKTFFQEAFLQYLLTPLTQTQLVTLSE